MRAIRHLVATAVNGLKPERVSVVDETGKLLADGAGNDNPLPAPAPTNASRLREPAARARSRPIVSSVVGPGHARVQITADFDVNRITQTSDKFDPDGRVVRSSQTREESPPAGDSKDGGRSRSATNCPAAQAAAAGRSRSRSDQNRKTEEIVNYEISRTTKTEVIEAGRVNRISAAVLVDGIYSKNDKGEIAYQPRSKEELDRIAALVRTAIGFDAKRGDQVEVVNLRFAETPPIPIDEADRLDELPAIHQGRHHGGRREGRHGAARPSRAVHGRAAAGAPDHHARRCADAAVAPPRPAAAVPAVTAEAAAAAGMMLPGGNGNITSTAGPNVSIVGGDEAVAISNRTSAMIDIAKVQGQVHAQSVQKVGELADKNPHEAVSIIRSWLHEDAA